jgi:7-keto-8-aminopelargonate synthetase-like enzyme
MNQLPATLRLMTETMSHAETLGVIHSQFTDYHLNGTNITLRNKELYHFANCSYLGLDVDARLKEAAKDAIERFGVQFSCSKTYLASPLYAQLEEKLSNIFANPTIVSPTTSLGHIAWIPNLADNQDVIVLDQQVHRSVQNAATMCKGNGTRLEVLRHNRMDLLEARIIELSKKYQKVWYMADGVYSMFGDVAPIQELYELMDKYEQFYVYIDDAHGMSWAGKHGRGYALNQVSYYHEKMCLITSLNKAFAANGGVMVFSDYAQKALIKNIGSPLIFSGPVAPVMLATGIVSADIHLSSEIYERQDRLQNLMEHFVYKARELDLPLIKEDLTPIFFICTGSNVCLDIAHELQEDGYFVNPSAYPIVPLKNAGIRITLNTHLTEDMITGLLTALKYRLDQRNIMTEEVMKTFMQRVLEYA